MLRYHNAFKPRIKELFMEYENKTFNQGETIELGDKDFINCTFDNCTLVFRGGDLPTFKGCQVSKRLKWAFAESAFNTLVFFSALNLSFDGLPDYGESIFKDFLEKIKGEFPVKSIH